MPDIDKRLHLVVAVVIFLSLLPAIISFLRVRMQQRSARAAAPPAPSATADGR